MTQGCTGAQKGRQSQECHALSQEMPVKPGSCYRQLPDLLSGTSGRAGECKPALSWLRPDKVALGENHLHLGYCMLETQGANLRNTHLHSVYDFCRENKSS